MTVEFDVEGVPRPQGSKNRNRWGGMYEAAKGLSHWRDLIGWAARNHHKGPPLIGPLALFLTFRLQPPKKMPLGRLLPDVTPDIDKLCRAALDSLSKGVVFEDDKQITSLTARKVYAKPPVAPGLHVIVERDIP